eukprot:gnl/TRDRNA2_/TRDRNA2_72082_c0_seq1.p1 gnl/TRDRNA2_/TRDRNA2_72082_c0~~gnl/TRDRNA2_/TRDRNA2_72082_c0_seq1.p1  ORF type:complete len:184 (+),score=39.05 gnl/TRDRNA2_/TRDRNA2_72082_c0_seq1:53-553(+)
MDSSDGGDSGGGEPGEGEVLKYMGDRGFGFIRSKEGGEDMFFHVSGLLDGDGSVQPGDVVTYVAQFNNRKGKWECVDVKATGEKAAAPEGSGEPGTGVAARWMADRGFGFIQPDGGSDDIFFHVRSLPDGEGSVNEGDKVTYTTNWNPSTGKWEAVDVRATGERAY